jgi:hypothetical protein
MILPAALPATIEWEKAFDLSWKGWVPMNNQIEPRRPVRTPPVHPLAALVTIVLDNLFTIPEIAGPEVWIITIPLIGGVGFVTTLLIQRYVAKDGWGASIAKAMVMAIIAGVPFSVTGTAAGSVLLVWAGLHEWLRLPAPKLKQPASRDGEIVEGEVKEVKKDP